ncbi:MAG: helix-turn-helix domain-containing protein [Myxococcota bacterium]
MHVLVVVALPGVVPFDLSVPIEVFGRATGPDGAPLYDVRVCGCAPEVPAHPFALQVPCGLEAIDAADTVVIAGVDDVSRPPPEAFVSAVRRAAGRGSRIASVCSGAFALAATGLLDGRRATTHWRAAELLARTYPRVRVDPDVLYVDEGSVLTSAGAAAAFDLCLHLVRRDHGAAAALEVARLSVMPPERDGGQAQFVVRPAPTDATSLGPALAWIEAHAHEPLSLEDIARQAHVSVRTLNRRFREQVGTTPLQWLIRARVRRGQALLERTELSVEQVADAVGFGSALSFRQHFRRVVGRSPQGWRRAFRSRRP